MKRKTKICFWGIILLGLFLSCIAMFLMPKKGNQVLVTQDKEQVGSYPLDKDQTLRFENGDDYNVIEIKEGVVRVTEASCKNQICVHSASISKEKPGMIVCLPNKLIVEIQE